jgi:type II secretory pathway pseudopilin PulG
MNPELTPREELELRITALLLGELSEPEAAAVRAEMAKDTELQKLHDDLQQTIFLVREASMAADAASTEQAEPLKLSEERRAQLRAAFIIPPLKPEHVKPRARLKLTLIEVCVALAIMAVVASMMLPALGKAKSKAQSVTIRNNLKQLDLAKQMWAEDNKRPAGAEPTAEELKTYLAHGTTAGDELVRSVANEKYVIGKVGESPRAEQDGRSIELDQNRTSGRASQVAAAPSAEHARPATYYRLPTELYTQSQTEVAETRGERFQVSGSFGNKDEFANRLGEKQKELANNQKFDIAKAAGKPTSESEVVAWNLSTSTRGYSDADYESKKPAAATPPAGARELAEPSAKPAPRVAIELPKVEVTDSGGFAVNSGTAHDLSYNDYSAYRKLAPLDSGVANNSGVAAHEFFAWTSQSDGSAPSGSSGGVGGGGGGRGGSDAVAAGAFGDSTRGLTRPAEDSYAKGIADRNMFGLKPQPDANDPANQPPPAKEERTYARLESSDKVVHGQLGVGLTVAQPVGGAPAR